jgi:hypothetical protein
MVEVQTGVDVSLRFNVCYHEAILRWSNDETKDSTLL